MSWQQRIDRALDERRAAEAFRRRLPVSHGAGRWLEREGERWLNFSSNDYLGLSQYGAIIAAWQQGRNVMASVPADRATLAAIVRRIARWKRNLPTGWAIRARCCLSPALPRIRR